MRSALTLTLILGGCYELFDLEPAASGAVDEQRSSSSPGYGCAISRNRRWPCGLKNGSGAMAAVLRRRQSWRWCKCCW